MMARLRLPVRARVFETALLLAVGACAPACSNGDSGGKDVHVDAGNDARAAGDANHGGGGGASGGGGGSDVDGGLKNTGGTSNGGASGSSGASGTGGSIGDASAGASSGDGSVLGPDSVTGEDVVTIGADGGTVSLDGASLVVPPGALDADVEITMRRWKNPLPPPITGYSPRYEFLPDGTTFKRALSLTIPFQGGADARVFWSTPEGHWEDHGGTIVGDTIRTVVTHFSSGGAGGTPSCPTQGGNTICSSAFGAGWLCCYALTLDPQAEVSYCYDHLHDHDHCGGCDEIFACSPTQFCQNNAGSVACVTCDPSVCTPQ